jgi:DNA polymerase-3 subunit delta'
MALEENPDTGKMRQMIVIDQVLRAREYLSLRPVGGGRKVLVVDGAHLMNVNAANAFLKTLEEPPAHTHIVLVTSRPGMLIETIISRTRAIGFQPLPDAVVQKALVEQKGMKASDAELVAKVSMGRLGQALDTDPKQIRKDRKRFLDTLDKVDEGGYADIIGLAERVAKDIDKLRSFVVQGRLFFRDIQVVWMSGDYQYAYYGDAPDDIARWSERFGPDGAEAAMRLIENAAFALDKTYNNRMAAEELFLGIKEDALGRAARV